MAKDNGRQPHHAREGSCKSFADRVRRIVSEAKAPKLAAGEERDGTSESTAGNPSFAALAHDKLSQPVPAAQQSPSGSEAGTASVGKTETVLSRGELDAHMAAPVQGSLRGTQVMEADESLYPIDDAIEEQLKDLGEELQAIENSMPDENDGIHSDRPQYIASEQTAGDLGIPSLALVNNATIPSPGHSGEKRTNDPFTPQSDAEMEAILASIGDGEVQPAGSPLQREKARAVAPRPQARGRSRQAVQMALRLLLGIRRPAGESPRGSAFSSPKPVHKWTG